MYINGAGLNFATQPGGIGLTEYYRRIAEGFPNLKANQLAYEMDTYDITPEDVLNAFQKYKVQANINDILEAYERGGGRKFLTTGEQERYAREAAAAAAADSAAAAAQERVRLAAEAAARDAAAAATKAAQDAAAAATKAAQDAAAAAAKVAADAAAATKAADAARAKAALDLKYSFLDPSIADKSPEDKAAYFNFLKSKGYSEPLIFEAIAYWIGPQSPEAIAALKTLADELAKPKPIVEPRLPPIVIPQMPITPTAPTTPAPGGANTGLLLAAGLAALTLLG
jgi:hypothetical protein